MAKITYEAMKKDCAYRVTKGNTDGGILVGDILYIDSRDDSLVLSGAGWYTKNEELQDEAVTDFECEIAEEYRVFSWCNGKGIIRKEKLESALKGHVA